jgi:tungstate transport system permease protein
MIIGYMVIALPVLVVFTLSAVQGADPRVYETARSLGAGRWRAALATLFEVRFGVMAAIFNGFGRVVSEVGLLDHGRRQYRGAHAQHSDRNRARDQQGEFAQGIALGLC